MTRWGYAAIAVAVAIFVAAVCLHVGLADRLPDAPFFFVVRFCLTPPY